MLRVCEGARCCIMRAHVGRRPLSALLALWLLLLWARHAVAPSSSAARCVRVDGHPAPPACARTLRPPRSVPFLSLTWRHGALSRPQRSALLLELYSAAGGPFRAPGSSDLVVWATGSDPCSLSGACSRCGRAGVMVLQVLPDTSLTSSLAAAAECLFRQDLPMRTRQQAECWPPCRR